MMLASFLTAHRDEIILRARARVAARASPVPSDVELTNGIPVFLDQLCEALRVAEASDVVDHEQISASAGRHGEDLLRMGLTIAQVVRDYGDVCQVITQLAIDEKAPISGEEFQTLNLCLDDAIAEAVSAYARLRERAIVDEGTERLGVLAHELRNVLNTAMLSFETIRSGRVAPGGSTGAMHGRSLLGLRDLVDRSLSEVRLEAGRHRIEYMSVADFLAEVEIGASMQAEAVGILLVVGAVNQTVFIEGDRPLLAAALSNLLQNAFKFTGPGGRVSMTTRVTDDRVLLDVEDECGGLPPRDHEGLFLPFKQRALDRSGAGLGLSIARKAARANGGDIHVRDLPGKGCVFTLALPRRTPPPLSSIDGGMHRSSEPSGAGPGSRTACPTR